MEQTKFDPQRHISKFIFEKYGCCTGEYQQTVAADLYLKELKVEIRDYRDHVIDVYGYSLSGNFCTLLPLLEWDKFELNRDVSEWDLENSSGYRDGWGYKFLCMNESGNPLIQRWIHVTFKEQSGPAYDKLLNWIIKVYSKKKEFVQYNLLW